MLFSETETARINRLIAGNAGMTEREFFARQIARWKVSKERMEQIQGNEYYNGKQDILHRRRTVIGEDGKLVEVDNLPNNRIVYNLFAKLVDQKTNYLSGKPPTIQIYSGSQEAKTAFSRRIDKSFQRTMKYLAEDALLGGVGWLFVYYDRAGKLSYQRFPAWQVLPFWADDSHTRLDAAVRLYQQEVWEGLTMRLVERVELYKPDGIYRYVYENGVLTPDRELGEMSHYLTVDGQGYAWERFPLLCFKRNRSEIPLIRGVKGLQDGINQLMSDWENNTEEDTRNTILIIHDYEGENLGEFRKNLATYGAVHVRENGGVEALKVEVNAGNYTAILEAFKKAMIESAMGFDAKDDRLGGNANQMNIQSMYSDIDLDSNGMETEFQAALEDLLWFVKQDMKTKGEGDFSEDIVEILFNRDILINESEAVENCAKSAGLLSTETLVEQHPWTRDAATELGRLKREKEQAEDDYRDAFGGTDKKDKNE